MSEKFKSGRDVHEEHRHDDWRQYDALINSILKYEPHLDAMQVIFRSKYTEQDIIDILENYDGNPALIEDYLIKRKDDEFKDLINSISIVESQTAHSCAVIKSHKRIRKNRATMYKWLYHSLEEYLVTLYNEGVDFVLYQTHLRDILLKRENELEYLVPVLAQGEMLVRAMRHDPLRSLDYMQELYIIYTLLANPQLYGDSRIFIKKKFDKKKPKEIWHLHTLKRSNYKSSRKYKGE